MKHFLIVWFLCASLPVTADIAYQVAFAGVETAEIESLLRSSSQLITLQACPPSTSMALQRRAEAEIPALITILHSKALFDAEVTLKIDFNQSPALVTFLINSGPTYPLVAFDILSADNLPENAFSDFDTMDPAELGIHLGDPAYPQTILDAEKAVIDSLDALGYPFAAITKREVVADQSAKNVKVKLYVDSGSLAYFGKTVITGLKSVRKAYIRRKIGWREDDMYSPDQLQCTFNAIDATGLFANIQITPGECEEGTSRVPIEIELTEGYHRSIGLGGSWETQQGGGVIAEWEHRNVRGMGERVRVKTELMQKLQSGSASYSIPDFLTQKQELVTRAEAKHEITQGFHDTSMTLSSRINRWFNECMQGSAGVALKYLATKDSDNNHPFTLAKIPLQFLFNNTGAPLDPTHGESLNFRFTPTFELGERFSYYTTNLDAALYTPLGQCTVFASKVSIGSILGAARINVPPPERLYAGTPQLLRGYRYMTVSPLNAQNKPIGGLSLLVFSFELRRRFGEDWGGTLFYEVGNVYATTTPEIGHKQLQSAGFGIRYYTAVGPLRLDIAFPLNRRKAVDGRLQVYFNIGQTF